MDGFSTDEAMQDMGVPFKISPSCLDDFSTIGQMQVKLDDILKLEDATKFEIDKIMLYLVRNLQVREGRHTTMSTDMEVTAKGSFSEEPEVPRHCRFSTRMAHFPTRKMHSVRFPARFPRAR